MSQLDQRCVSQESHKNSTPPSAIAPISRASFFGECTQGAPIRILRCRKCDGMLPARYDWLGGQHSPNVPQGYGILSPRLEIQILASDQTISVSPSRARQTFPSWWKPGQLRLATLGLRSKLAPHQRFHPFQQPRLGQLPNPLLPHPLPVTCDSLPQYRWCGQRKTGQLCANLTARPSMRHRCGHQDCCD